MDGFAELSMSKLDQSESRALQSKSPIDASRNQMNEEAKKLSARISAERHNVFQSKKARAAARRMSEATPEEIGRAVTVLNRSETHR